LGDEISFGPFQVNVSRRYVSRDGVLVSMGSRAFDLLQVLLERPGEVVAKEDLIARLWPNIFVDESALRYHMSALRKALRDDDGSAGYIKTVSGRGYCFAAPLQRGGELVEKTPGHAALPPLRWMVGRDPTVKLVSRALENYRLVTVVGPGGIGKTTVAIAVGHSLLREQGVRAYFFDLAPVGRGDRVLPYVASHLGLGGAEALRDLLLLLNERPSLVIFDCCERLLDAVSDLAEQLYAGVEHCEILCTSREALGVTGERMIRLAPLEYPAARPDLTAAEALASPAVQVLCEAAAASSSDFAIADNDAPAAVEICRKVDGVALALGLVGARAHAFGIPALSELLDQRSALYWKGRRTAPSRQMSLAATLDWSYDLLEAREQALLRALSVFAAPFDLTAASTVGSTDSDAVVIELLPALVAKSLIQVSLAPAGPSYRLLDMTRSFAREKAEVLGEAEMLARRHASYVLSYLKAIPQTFHPDPTDDELATHRRLVPDLMAALTWSFGSEGDLDLGLSLAERAHLALIPLLRLQEVHEWSGAALKRLPRGSQGGDMEMVLQGVRALSALKLMHIDRVAADRSLELARNLEDTRSYVELSVAMSNVFHNQGATDLGLGLAEAAVDLIDPEVDLKTFAIAKANLASLLLARSQPERGMAEARDALRIFDHLPAEGLGRFALSTLNRCRGVYSSLLWINGFPDQALDWAQAALRDAEALNPQTFLEVVHVTAPVYWWRGELPRIEPALRRSASLVGNTSSSVYRPPTEFLLGAMMMAKGQTQAGIALLDSVRRQAGLPSVVMASLELAKWRLGEGEVQDALADLRTAEEISVKLANVLQTEIDRQTAEALAATGESAEAQARIDRAFESARRRGARGLELRVAISAVKVARRLGSDTTAVEALRAVYDSFTEGFDTLDAQAARELLGAH
jgi:predicted ATPase/DNA-binding winged helix-turn-helix (wHTH) protein